MNARDQRQRWTESFATRIGVRGDAGALRTAAEIRG